MRISAMGASLPGVLACLLGCGDPLPPLHLDSPYAACSDGKMDDAETDLDCGGGFCDPCELNAGCGVNADCASNQCEQNVCVGPPTAAFTLSSASLTPTQMVTATSGAHEGSSPIRDTSYDWDDGQGFEPSDRHTYGTGGSYLVRQRITDERGVSVTTAPQSLEVVDTFRQTRFSATDLSASVRLSPDRLSVEQRGLDPGGVRSDEPIAPMSHVYYFEVERLIARVGNWGFGVATARETLTNEIGHQSESMGVLTLGGVFNNTMEGQPLANCTRTTGFPPEAKIFGFVVDYRGVNPRIHLVIDQDGTPVVSISCNMGVRAPLHIFYSGSRYEIGFQARINTGADTTNHPFHFSLTQLVTALTAASQSIPMGEIVYGFGGTRALPASMPPSLNAPGDQSVALGKAVTLMASATDPEDGSLTNKITWLDTTSQHHAPVEGVGGTFAFKPSVIGRHPLRVSVRDSVGNVTSKLVQVDVTGALPQPNPVLLAPDAFGGGSQYVTLSEDALAARFTGPGKYGVRANQGIFRGSFQYFEAHREKPSGNMGVGVIIGEGLINPYHFDDVPWSCSVNLTGNTWRNLIDLTVWDGAANDRYGFAVDYRGAHPIVHILVGSEHTAKLESSLTLDDVWVPLYPMVYGNPQEGTGPDISINFGAEAFQFDPRALVPGGAELQLGWGINRR